MKNAVHQYEDKLLEFAYGELSAAEMNAVDAHVRGCTRCAQSLAQLRAVRSTVQVLPPQPAPEAGLESLLAFAEQQARRNAATNAPRLWWKRLTTPRLLASFASLAAMVTVGVVTWRASESDVVGPMAELAAAPSEAPSKDIAEVKDERFTQREAQGAVALAEPNEAPARAKPTGPLKAPPAPKSSVQDKMKRAESKAEVASNFSDAYRGGADRGRAKEATTEDFEATFAERSPQKKGGPSGGFGLGTSGAGLSESGKRDGAKKPSAEPVVAASTAAPAPSPASPAAAAPRESKSGGALLGYAQQAPGDAEDDLKERADTLAVNEAASGARQRVERRKVALDQARAAGQRNDRLSEVKLSLVVIEQGAVGSERGEALKRVCDGYESLGEFERADPYCDALVREFPTTTAAQDVSRRRGFLQRAVVPSKPAAKALVDEAPKAPEPRELRAKVPAAPASSH